MAAGVAHEINNPLAIINEKAGLLNDLATYTKDLPNKEKFSGLADSIINSVERCSRVTHRLLGFARRMETRKELVDLKQLLEDVVGFQKSDLAHRNINVTYNIPSDLKPIESDRGQLQQVFLNIVNNAVAAVDIGGHVDIMIDDFNDDTVKVTIKDDGVGISKENLDHIFEPFYSTKGEFGTGLGLSITHDIVQKLGGRIEVRSQPEEETSFDVILPRRASY
jgi:two-component system NtrC family sensor kinase